MRMLNPRTWLTVVFTFGCEMALAQDAEDTPQQLPDMASISDVEEKKQTFFEFLNPLVQDVNRRIEAERVWLQEMQRKRQEGQSYEDWQTALMNELGDYYKVDPKPGTPAYFKAMLLRVDIIPASLVLAQAANESAWGTSRFAVEGNNLFGQWCFVEGCGLVPAGRDGDENHEVKVFDSVADSVEAYFRNVNTHASYRELRNIRAELRYLGLSASSEYLVWGLESYSSRGEEYISDLLQMIRYNDLQRYDHLPFYAMN